MSNMVFSYLRRHTAGVKIRGIYIMLFDTGIHSTALRRARLQDVQDISNIHIHISYSLLSMPRTPHHQSPMAIALEMAPQMLPGRAY